MATTPENTHIPMALPRTCILITLLLLSVKTRASVVRAACAADYSSCGSSLPSPVGTLPCCNSSFYCYKHGPYFSQCRPIHETERVEQTAITRKSLCGQNYGVCSAGTSADTKLRCCDPDYVCVPASPLFWQCVPPKSRWYEVQVGSSKMLSFLDDYAAVRMNARMLETHEKVVGKFTTSSRGLRVSIPVMNHAERDEFERYVRDIDGVRYVDRGVGEVFVEVNHSLEKVSRSIAAMSQVAKVKVV